MRRMKGHATRGRTRRIARAGRRGDSHAPFRAYGKIGCQERADLERHRPVKPDGLRACRASEEHEREDSDGTSERKARDLVGLVALHPAVEEPGDKGP